MITVACEKDVPVIMNDKADTRTKEQAIQECNKIMKDDLAARVLVDKYLLCDMHGYYYEWTPAQMWDRLSAAIVKPEEQPQQEELRICFRRLLDDYKFVPAGRILYGLGNPYVNVTLKNCYVIGIEEDSIEGIFKAAWRMAETYKGGGGCGIDISPLRPKGSPVHNAARSSSGAVSFMDFFSHITGMIGQKARIGALLICIDVSHPDVEDFVEIKGGDNLDLVRYANVSIKVTDEFMRAVEQDNDFDLHWGGQVYKTIKARKLWNRIVHKAWKRAEPGILFWDTTCNNVPAHNYPAFRCIATNPCLSGATRILTEHGYRTARELWAQGDFEEYDGAPSIEKHGEIKIVNSSGIVSATNVYRTSECADIFRVTLKNGIEIDATKNHTFIVKDDEGNKHKRMLSELKVGDKIPINQQQIFGGHHYPEYARSAGWVIGDGSIAREKRDGQIRAKVRVWGTDIEHVLPVLRQDMLSIYNKSNKSTNQSPSYDGRDVAPDGFDTPVREITSSVLGRLMYEDGLEPGNKHHVPKTIWDGDKSTVAAFISGLFSVDGGVQVSHYKKSISIRICQVNKSILSECQLLLNQFDINSSVSLRRKACKKLMNDGKGGKEYELIISGRCNVMRYIEEIGFIQPWKNDIATKWIASHLWSNNSKPKDYSKVKSIAYIGNGETFCLTEPQSHEIVANMGVIAQCGEVPLSHGDSCNLGSMNLGKYVIDPFRQPEFDTDRFRADTKMAVRFLDNIISLERAPMKFQQAANDNGRRLGLGIMGIADMFLKMRIRFDSDEAYQLTDTVMHNFMIASYEASCDLAEEKGAFPAFDPAIHLKSAFIQRLPQYLQDRIRDKGIRNISINAIAPTGSIACVAGCSSGIEPVFMMQHIRKTNLGTAKKVEKHLVFHSVAKQYLNEFENGSDDEAKLPDYFVSSHAIEPDHRIRLQGLIQSKIDLSISNTVNLPNASTEEQVAYYYMQAWKHGCKGITIYRDGSREGVLQAVNEPVSVSEIMRTAAPKRPQTLEARVHVVKPNGNTFTVFVGLLNGRPYEVFALDHTLAGLPDNTQGQIIRVYKDQPDADNEYNFEKGALTVHMLNRYEDQDASLVTRLLSTSLRHGVPLEFLIDQMSKSQVPVTSLAKAIARALSNYIKADEVKGKFKCPDCRSRNLKWEGTCFSCLDCGFNRCS